MTRAPAALLGRLARARARLAELGLDGHLVTHPPNVRYLTGFTGSSGWLLLGPDDALFGTDGRYGQQAEEELPAEAAIEIIVSRDGGSREIASRAETLIGPGSVGFESDRLTYAAVERIRGDGGSVEWRPVPGVVEGLRAVKDEDEIAAIQRAVRVAEQGLEEVFDMIAPGVRERDIANELDYRMRRLGADRPAFETIVAGGPRTAFPHAATTDRPLVSGDLVLCDFGARCEGYCSDLTRTFVIGEADPRQREVYAAVLEAQRAACSALSAGTTAAAVDGAARDALGARDMADAFVHSTGHGVGLEVHEAPRLRRGEGAELEAGMVVTVEPAVYFPGWGGVRLEGDFVVTEGSARALAAAPDQHPRTLPPS